MPRRTTAIRFGQHLRQARLAIGLSQATIAEAAGVAVETISRVERGHPVVISIDLAEKLAKVVKVPLADLLVATAPKPPEPGVRPALERIVALLAPLDDAALADVYQGLRRLLGVRTRPRKK